MMKTLKKAISIMMCMALMLSCAVAVSPVSAQASVNLHNEPGLVTFENKSGYTDVSVKFFKIYGDTPYGLGLREVQLRRRVPGGSWYILKTWTTISTLSVNTLSANDDSVKTGKKYDYMIKAYYKDGTINNIYSDSVNCPYQNTYLAPVSNLKAVYSKTNKTIKVTFTNVAQERGIVRLYKNGDLVKNGNFVKSNEISYGSNASSKTFELKKVLTAGTYTVKVRAQNADGAHSCFKSYSFTVK